MRKLNKKQLQGGKQSMCKNCGFKESETTKAIVENGVKYCPVCDSVMNDDK
jgi:RNA polymerase subunit RPABC4/transcription elongation factor Spt4